MPNMLKLLSQMHLTVQIKDCCYLLWSEITQKRGIHYWFLPLEVWISPKNDGLLPEVLYNIVWEWYKSPKLLQHAHNSLKQDQTY